MQRQYPRYLVSKEFGNTKSKGPFLIHTLPPRFIARIHAEDGNQPPYRLEFLKEWDLNVPSITLEQQLKHAMEWMKGNDEHIKASF